MNDEHSNVIQVYTTIFALHFSSADMSIYCQVDVNVFFYFVFFLAQSSLTLLAL